MKLSRKIGNWIPPGITRWSAIISILLLAIAWAVPPLRMAPMFTSGEIIPLHYNIYFGVDYLGAWRNVFILPGFATIVFIVNLVLSVRVRHESKLLSNILSIAHSVVALVVILALFFVLLINV